MEIAACPKCGSRNIEMGTMGSGVLFGVTSWKSVCKECGYQGEPLLFDTEDDYKKFLRGFVTETNTQKAGEPEQNEVVTDEEEIRQLSKKDKEVVQLLHEFEEKEQPKKITTAVFPEGKKWRVEIGFSIVFSAIFTFFYITNTFVDPLNTIPVVWSFFLFIFFAVIALFVIAIIEFFYYSIKNKVKKE